ncbi:hypothetical protein ASD64_16590 [Mesorhizobium sp. Root157]|uniref:hypothetical protein n=1 Tax=Mesorhizobium sp. Root157 TaxID=1736477 RepID=UPI0007013E79|nr:hypothetical protein [Mesorhizobium sp. Root157]KQZ97820.1 hypothetical protein ASD64_16590 [Mesorhizobium sp. Root157]
MTGERDRIRRAGNYVLGLLDDEERERAERDLEIDPAFRDAVLQLAERAHVFDLGETPANQADAGWRAILQRISELPQVQAGAQGASANGAAVRPPISSLRHGVHGAGLRPTGGKLGPIVALGLILMFALGYLVGKL